jgi:hypothetical protein
MALRFFPDIKEEQSPSTCISPLQDTIQELKQKYVVTTADFSATRISLLDTRDHWGTMEPSQEDVPADPPDNFRIRRRATSSFSQEFPTPRSSYGHSSPQLSSTIPRQPPTRQSPKIAESYSAVCNRTGWALEAQNPRQRRLTIWLESTQQEGLKKGSGTLEGTDGIPSHSPRQRRLASWLEYTRKECQHDKALLLAFSGFSFLTQLPTETDLIVKGDLGA